MLYNEAWSKSKVEADPFSLESLITWLEKMPGDQAYNYWECSGHCLYGQYTASRGIEWQESGHYDGKGGDQAEKFCAEVYSSVAYSAPHTFGAALTRAREALASRA